MTRKITVTIRKIASAPQSQSGVISCTVLYHYETRYTYTLTDNNHITTSYTKDYSADVNNDFYSRYFCCQ